MFVASLPDARPTVYVMFAATLGASAIGHFRAVGGARQLRLQLSNGYGSAQASSELQLLALRPIRPQQLQQQPSSSGDWRVLPAAEKLTRTEAETTVKLEN